MSASPILGSCGLVSGCTGDRPLRVITREELEQLGSLHEVNLFVRLSGLRAGGLWCRECHQQLRDATSTGQSEAGRKRDFQNISDAGGQFFC